MRASKLCCFANVVLQCLMYTRPLVAYLLEKGHRGECRRNDWCFLCEFQTHVVRASESRQPFSPINILSRLPNIGGNLGYGKQEDAHEFMRFAIDTMQSVCLDEYGGEKAVDARTQETTLIQHIFGGHLQSQVICTKCNNISNQYENMMDLTVEIHGDAASLEECLNQFTVRERLHGDNMYKCDGCNDYVMAWKRLTVRKAPNILTIALKRFQSGRFGKLNKRVTFPETLDLNPYMSEEGDGDNVYKLYAVIVHVDMLNASFFGHYICYTKDFYGNWYRIDDCKVTRVDLEEVLLQGAYMLMYSRVCARPSCLKAVESLGKDQQTVKIVQGGGHYAKDSVECSTMAGPIDSICMSGSLAPDSNSHSRVYSSEMKSPSFTNSEYVEEDMEILGPESSSSVPEDVEVHGNGYLNATEETASPVVDVDRLVSGDGSSLSERFEPEAYSLNYKLASSNYGVGGKNRAANGAKETTSSSSRSSLPKENGVCLGVETSHDGSVSGLSLDGDLNEDNPVDSKDHQEKMENKKGLPSASSVKDAEGKLAGRNSSGTKPKPLFPPGFLGRRSSNKSMKRGVRIMSEVGDFVSCNHMKGDGGFQEPGCHHENGARTQEVVNPHLEGNTSLPFTSGEEVGNCLDKDMVAHSKSGEFTNLCSGESATVFNDNKEINNIDRDGQPLIEKTPRAIVRSSMSETTRSDLVGTDVERL
ncbi:ubiquitin carboxyl-terminal hydrolase 18-like isoform X2 [Diospyros lotus]|uniref:ubiquitin carboxyl-terminal hydrolase 18-like isoform X2 n=1 Tax=Diospyros lotus TaxID=55363 RepID=UPI002257436F|nr:ubiquitin carboxyl-terminal hydrolase 18-like isoform X2 [Diospyros lotus]